MKKILYTTLTICLCMISTGCGTSTTPKTQEIPQEKNEVTAPNEAIQIIPTQIQQDTSANTNTTVN